MKDSEEKEIAKFRLIKEEDWKYFERKMYYRFLKLLEILYLK